jgi:hypothetical protein
MEVIPAQAGMTWLRCDPLNFCCRDVMCEIKNNEHSIPEDKIDLTEAITPKKIIRWFWIGLFASIFTFLIFGDGQHIQRLVKLISVPYITFSYLAIFIYRKWIGVKYYEKLIRKKDVKIMTIFALLFVFVIGHFFGFISINFVNNIPSFLKA